MFRTLSNLVKKDKDMPGRAHELNVLSKFLDDSIYDVLDHEFHEEYTPSREYIPIAQRAPSVRYGLLSIVVNDSVSFLFSEGRFPSIDAGDDEKAEETIAALIKDCAINDVMIDAAHRGSIGSVAIWLRVLSNRVFLSALNTNYLTPTFKTDLPDTLEKVVELYKVKGATLRESGYLVLDDDLTSEFWFQREWNATKELWFRPVKVDGKNYPTVEDLTPGRTVVHGLGFVPMVWIKNLPGGDGVDGACTFKAAIHNSIEINYQLSQAGRGLKYSSSPTLVIKDANPSSEARKHVVGDALIIPTDGDAKMLEISGGAAAAVIQYVEGLRKMALETVGGSRADSDKLSAATSGRAMEMMNQALINLSDKLRSSYGENGLLKILKMIAAISRKIKLVDSAGKVIAPIPEATILSLVWARWFAPTSDDRLADANAIAALKAAGVLSTETAVRAISADYDVEDLAKEISDITKESDVAQARQIELKTPAPDLAAKQ